MILFGVEIQDPVFNDQNTFDLRVVTNYNMNQQPSQVKLSAAAGNILQFVSRFKNCTDEYQTIRQGFVDYAANPVGFTSMGYTYYGVFISEPDFVEDKTGLFTVSLSFYVLDISESGDFILDPDGNALLDPTGMPLEAP